MKDMNRLFTVVMVTLMVLSMFLIADTIFIGLISIIISIFSKSVAIKVFEWGLAILFTLETLFTIPLAIKSINEGDKSNGS